jgi:hypothetical protein
MTRFPFSVLYLALIPLVNWMFSWAPLFPLPDGSTWTPFTIVTGLVLVFRDFAQREIGNKVGYLLLIGTVFSYFLAAPEIAIVSGIAFMISEGIDWLVYNLYHQPLYKRVLLSSIISAPIDSMIFLYGANLVVPGIFSGWSVAASVSSKLVGAAIVAYIVKKKGVGDIGNKPSALRYSSAISLTN